MREVREGKNMLTVSYSVEEQLKYSTGSGSNSKRPK